MKRQRNKGGLIALLLLVGVLGTSAFAFTNNNVIDPQDAGDGTNTVSGFTVSAVHFSMPDDPAAHTVVSFHLDPQTATVVKASGSANGTGLVDCDPVTDGTDGDWTCALGQTLNSAAHLRIAATN